MGARIEQFDSADRASPLLVCYLPVGDPLCDVAAAARTYCDAGVDVIEVGIPSADAYRDGLTIRSSMLRALSAGVNASTVPQALRAVLPVPRPLIVWMCYPEVPLAAFQEGATSGLLDAVLMLDAHDRTDVGELEACLSDIGVARCAFVSASESAGELAAARSATGYVMVQTRPGPTGTDAPAGPVDPDMAQRVRRATDLPVVAGFGVRNGVDAAAVIAAGFDGVVVGSACVEAAADAQAHADQSRLRQLVTGLYDGVKLGGSDGR